MVLCWSRSTSYIRLLPHLSFKKLPCSGGKNIHSFLPHMLLLQLYVLNTSDNMGFNKERERERIYQNVRVSSSPWVPYIQIYE